MSEGPPTVDTCHSKDGGHGTKGRHPLMHKYRLVEALGLTVVTVDTITDKAILVDGQPVVLVRPDLTDHDQDHLLDWLLPRLAQRMSRHQPR